MMRLFVLGLLLLLTACDEEAPPCPVEDSADQAPSAGCLALVHGRMLVVETYNGEVGPPGGKSREGESAQCAAHRETWEETGLDIRPERLLYTFGTGFNLYYCEFYRNPGQLSSRYSEVRRAFWLPLDEFDTVSWRYPGQGQQLLKLVNRQPAEQNTTR